MQSFRIFFLLIVASLWAKTTGFTFYEKVNGVLNPLSVDRQGWASTFTTIPSKELVAEFSFHEGYVKAEYVHNSGKIGFYGRKFGYGPYISPEIIKLDVYGRVTHPKLFGCRDSKDGNVSMFTTQNSIHEFCYPAEIYLLPR